MEDAGGSSAKWVTELVTHFLPPYILLMYLNNFLFTFISDQLEWGAQFLSEGINFSLYLLPPNIWCNDTHCNILCLIIFSELHLQDASQQEAGQQVWWMMLINAHINYLTVFFETDVSWLTPDNYLLVNDLHRKWQPLPFQLLQLWPHNHVALSKPCLRNEKKTGASRMKNLEC